MVDKLREVVDNAEKCTELSSFQQAGVIGLRQVTTVLTQHPIVSDNLGSRFLGLIMIGSDHAPGRCEKAREFSLHSFMRSWKAQTFRPFHLSCQSKVAGEKISKDQ